MSLRCHYDALPFIIQLWAMTSTCAPFRDHVALQVNPPAVRTSPDRTPLAMTTSWKPLTKSELLTWGATFASAMATATTTDNHRVAVGTVGVTGAMVTTGATVMVVGISTGLGAALSPSRWNWLHCGWWSFRGFQQPIKRTMSHDSLQQKENNSAFYVVRSYRCQ